MDNKLEKSLLRIKTNSLKGSKKRDILNSFYATALRW